jgi:RNA polymerase sigma-70 factor (ECF subfamily)
MHADKSKPSDSSVAGAESAAAKGVFVTTHWSLVLSAQDRFSPKSSEALEALCKAYWRPLYTYVRSFGKSEADAEDLTQAFFARLLQKDFLHSACKEKGRFRTFLLVALKRFMANEWDRQHTQKRGGFAQVTSLDANDSEPQPGTGTTYEQPDRAFDRQWAQTLLERTFAALRAEYTATGRAELFDHIENCLAKDESALSYAEIGARLKLSEAAVKMAVFRLKARFRELLRKEVAETVCSEEEVEDEIKHLFSAF